MIETCSFILVILGAVFVFVIHELTTAPSGEEIPGVGFVETRDK